MLTNYISVWNVCMRNIFAKYKHYHHNQHSNSLHCPLHWWSFRDQVNICWNHTKPNCNARNRTDSINHTSNLYVEICLYVIGIKSFTAFIQWTVDWKACQSLSSLSKHWGWFWEKADTFLNKAPCACEINGVFHQYNFIYSGQTILAINMKLRNLHLSRIFCMWSMRIWYDCILVIWY